MSETEIVERLKQSMNAVMDARLEEVTKTLHDRAEAAEAEAVRLRERLADAERAAEVRLARIEVLRGALEIVGVETQALKPEVQQVRVGVLDLMRERDDLRQQLATVTALVPEVDWLEMIALFDEPLGPTDCKGCPFDCNCDLQCERVCKQAGDLAARIRAWRGDGDGEGGEDGKDNRD